MNTSTTGRNCQQSTARQWLPMIPFPQDFVLQWQGTSAPTLNAFGCGHVGVTLEKKINYSSVYDLHWSHYYSEVIHIQNNLLFNADFISRFVQVPFKNYLNIEIFCDQLECKMLVAVSGSVSRKKIEPVPETVSNC